MNIQNLSHSIQFVKKQNAYLPTHTQNTEKLPLMHILKLLFIRVIPENFNDLSLKIEKLHHFKSV